jgi:hypothetical protein
MEDMDLPEKLSFLKQHKEWKNIKKWEVLDEHATTWRANGLADLKYSVTDTREMSRNCTVFTVDVQLNNHWSDDLSGIDITG